MDEAPVFVFAPHLQWARYHLAGVDPRRWRYVSGPHQVLGVRDARYLALTGRDEHLSPAAEIALGSLQARGGVPIRLDELRA